MRLAAAVRAQPEHRIPARDRRAPTPTTRSTWHATDGQQYLSQVEGRAAAGPRRRRSRRSPSALKRRPTQAPARRPATSAPPRSHAGSRPDAVPVLRAGLPDRALPRRAVRPVDLGARGRRAVQPRQRGHALDDQRRSEHRARDGHERCCRRSSRACPIRLRTISVDTNKQGFLLNPTNCGAARDRIHAHLDARRDAERVERRSRRKLQRARVQTVVQGDHRRAKPRKPTARALKRRSTSRPARRTSNRCSSSCPSSCPRG